KRIRIERMLNERTGTGRRIWANSHPLMVDTRRNSTTDRRGPIFSAVVANVGQTVSASELGGPDSASARVSQQNRIGRRLVADSGRGILELPSGLRRRS